MGDLICSIKQLVVLAILRTMFERYEIQEASLLKTGIRTFRYIQSRCAILLTDITRRGLFVKTHHSVFLTLVPCLGGGPLVSIIVCIIVIVSGQQAQKTRTKKIIS